MPKPGPLLLAACLAVAGVAGLSAPLAAAAGERDSFLAERPGFDEPLRFRAGNGGAFRPRAIVVTGPGGAIAAPLPAAATARSEDRVDLSGAPVIGPLFRETLDVASVRQGPLVGPVYRVGDSLVVEASVLPTGLEGRPVALATNVPRYGAVSYALGRLDWRRAAAPDVTGAPIGSAHLVGGALVLASEGGEPAWPSVEALLRDIF